VCDLSHISGTADELALVMAARAAADELLGRYLRIRVAKAMDLGTPHGFDQAVARLAGELRRHTAAADGAAVLAAISVLDVDWRRTTPAQRRELIAQAMAAAGRRTAVVPAQLEAVFGPAADAVVRAGRAGTRRDQHLAIRAELNAFDARVIQHLRTSQTHFVRDEYGRRHEAFSERARQIVADGLAAGLGRDDLAQDLKAAATGILAGRAAAYWDVVAGVFMARGRSYAQLSAYAEAGIARYRIVAVLDEVTTPTCRFLDGKTFAVSDGLDRFDQVEAAPDQLPELTPWIREQRDPPTGRRSLYVARGDARIPVAEIERSGVGTRDDRGEFSGALGERALGDLGIGFPPYHALCRSTTVGIA
jgi:SPP1 gp7 family putative phage head morphogenesis protein